jgi:hypothetical protein
MTAKETAAKFLHAAQEAGFTVIVKNPTVVAVSRTFTPGDTNAYVDCDMLAPGILGMLGARGGSMWGSDGAGVGGMIAINSGRFTLNVSGVPKRVSSVLTKMV